ncbi:condensation domain-containing protein [Streptomyces sp. NBRC 109706]|uniref:condensation domain-containing protein n=1 Tax=Streptomyces sp. NBRC 109706 TaxID=1550035 RepID=UPI000783A5A5|nr:condensation domain-containing protein [Streptomyces sp. NBRC 109706]
MIGKIAFTGSRTATAPMTWGQRETWKDVAHFLPTVMPFFFIRRRVEVPEGLDLAAVLDTIGTLISRHETLRTRLIPSDAGLEQHIVRSGVLEAEIADAPTREECVAALDAHQHRQTSVAFAHESELSLRVIVASRAGEPAMVGLIFSHVTLDMQSATLCAKELTALLAARAAGEPAPPASPARQPVDQALIEQSAEGTRRNEAALAHLRSVLETGAPSLFGEIVPTEGPRFRRGRLTSHTMPDQLRAVAVRTRSSPAAVLLAALTAMLYATADADECLLSLIYGNRSEPELRHAVGNVSQEVVGRFTRQGTTFTDLLRRNTATALRAYRHGGYDPVAADALIDEIERERGVRFNRLIRLNDMWSPTHATDRGGPRDLPAPEPAFDWLEGFDDDQVTLMVDVFGGPGVLHVVLLADMFQFPAPEVEAFALGLDRLLAELAGREVALDEIAAVTGLAGGRRSTTARSAGRRSPAR